jgi:hypothetical protein
LRLSHGARIEDLAYSPDGSRLSTVGSRWGLVWDLTIPQAVKPTTIADAWAGLAKQDARSALASIRFYADHPDEAVRYFKERVRPVPAYDQKQVAVWIAQLGSEEFGKREVASKQLIEIGEVAQSQLRSAAVKAESPEIRNRLNAILAPLGEQKLLTGDLLRAVRAIEALELIRTPAARELLKALAEGATDARLTSNAAAALKRLDDLLPRRE